MDGAGDVGKAGGFSFDFGNANDPRSEDANSSSNPSSPSKENHLGGHQQDAGMLHDKASADKEMFRNFANAGERQKTLDEFWNIVNKTFASEIIL